jgi:hypothetical protein
MQGEVAISCGILAAQQAVMEVYLLLAGAA